MVSFAAQDYFMRGVNYKFVAADIEPALLADDILDPVLSNSQ